MKDKLKKIVGCLVTLALIGRGLHVLNYVFRPLQADYAFRQIDSFHSMPKDTVEVIVYGSSHAYRSIDPLRLYKDYGIGAYDYSVFSERFNTTKLSVKDSLLSQKPKLAIIETCFVNEIRENAKMSLDIFYTRYFNLKLPILKYLRKCFGDSLEQYLAYFMPLSAFHDDWNALTEKNFRPHKNDGYFTASLGFKGDEDVKGITLYTIPDEEKPLSASSIEELDEIVADLTECGAEVLFITVPYSIKGGYPYGNAMEQYASEHNCTYLNLMDYVDIIGLDGNTDFSDADHLNHDGAAKFTAFLGDYIHTHYDLTDMRTIPNNLWERTAQRQSSISDEF